MKEKYLIASHSASITNTQRKAGLINIRKSIVLSDIVKTRAH